MNAKDVFKGTLIVLVTLAAAYIMLISVHILVVVLVAIIIASAVRPLVVLLTRLHVSEGLAIVVVYLTIVFGLFLLVALLIPPLATQFTNNMQHEDLLATRLIYAQTWLSDTLQPVIGYPIQFADPTAIRQTVSSVINQIEITMPTMVGGAGGTLGDAVLVFVMGAYWLTSYRKAVGFTTHLFSIKNREKVHDVIYEIEGMMGIYVRGIVGVAIFVGVANFIILTLLHIPNAGVFGFLVGLGTILPIVGGFLGGGLATLLALVTGSPVNALAVLATFVGVQQIETHYLTPRTMARSVGLDPLLTIIAVFIGFTLYGVVGAIVAAPLMGTIAVLLRELVIEPRKESVSPYKIEEGVVLLNAEPESPPTAPSEVVKTSS